MGVRTRYVILRSISRIPQSEPPHTACPLRVPAIDILETAFAPRIRDDPGELLDNFRELSETRQLVV